MKHKHGISAAILIFILLTGFFAQLTAADTKSQDIRQWLVLGPAKVPDIEKKLLNDDKTILDFHHNAVHALTPVQGEKVPWNAGQTLQWSVLKNYDFAGYETGVVYLATYLEPDRWLKTTLNVQNTNLGVSVFLDGKLQKATLLKDKITAPLELTNEKHLLLLKVLLLKSAKFTFKATLDLEEPFQKEIVAVSLSPRHKIRPENVLNMIEVSAISVSPDGKLVALGLRQTSPNTGNVQSWTEILTTAKGNMIFSSKNMGDINGFQWMNNSTAFTYTLSKKEKTAILQYDLNTHSQRVILQNVENLTEYWWAPDNSFLLYSTYEKDEFPEFHHIKEIPERSEFSGYHYSMYIYFPLRGGDDAIGTAHKLFDGTQDFQSAYISPDSKSVLFARSAPDNKNRPYNKSYYSLLDVAKLTVEPLLESNWIEFGNSSPAWSPDSRKLLMLGGPSSFDGLGRNLQEGKIPNDYDIQGYIYDLGTKKATAISKQFDPSIKDVSWSFSANEIYLTAEDKEDVGVFKYSLNKQNYTRLPLDVNSVHRIGFAAKRNIAVYWGSGAVTPQKLYLLNLSSGKDTVLKDYNKEYFQYVNIGTIKDWSFKTKEGRTIVGRLHLPPDFNPTKKYPCIVYYYGGTSPVSRDFGGRYPKNWYAANGYIVYVLQPTGTVGFGQESSAVHVNDWGVVTSEEIIEGVKLLTKEHPYIDPQRIGAMGASYGGFMTQYLAAHTDIFAAFISHAGISALSSYWGVGDWGYTYSGVATADSFPWNRKDIYVGHSPLFLADRITKPLLLLHGDIDNNVPPGESYQMFAALKLLGKEVELITFKGQRHFIQDYNKRLQWMRSIIAWWDKYLKNQPEHWDNMYKK